jgi:predicted lipoprotein with Yx(FWY)xxD motif
MENTMKQRLSTRLLALGIALGTALLLLAAAQASSVSHSRTRAAGALVTLRTTALGRILVDGRGHTLYLFEKDRNGVSMCNSACATYWPPLTSHGTPRAGKGVHQSLLRLARSRNGMRQVTYAGHPLYTFVGDKHAGQTTGQGLDNFGAEWYALAAGGDKVEH